MNTSSERVGTPAAKGSEFPFPYVETSSVAEAEAGNYSPQRYGEQGAAEETARRMAEARELGRRQGEADARAALEIELARNRESVAEILAAFARERALFYEKVEVEIVNLALSIARKILHREAQIDSLLLAGMVRVALEAIEFSTKVMVRVHPQLAASWREYFARHIDPHDLPELLEDPTLDQNRCVVETQLGKTELGWEVQLKEIEQGLLDLLARRPEANL